MGHIVIIGNGIAGVTAARHIRKKSNEPISIISSETDYFFARTAMMYIYMGHMKFDHTKPYEDWFWNKNDLNLIKDHVEEVDTNNKVLKCRSGDTVHYDVLILATGSKPRRAGWRGEDSAGIAGFVHYQDLEWMEHYTQNAKKAVIIGGGLIGVEVAECLITRNIDVTMLVRENYYWNNILPNEEAAMVGNHIRKHHVDLRLSTNTSEIIPDEAGHIKAVKTEDGEEIPCEFATIAIGVVPNIDFIKNSNIATDEGILVDHYFQTNIPDIYAIGDCAQFENPRPGQNPIDQIWYTARMHGETVAQTVLGKKTKYKPGVFFNSAKFFDIEYQVYGSISNKPKEGEVHFYWEDPKYERALRIAYEESTRAVKGINLMGIRFRHSVCEKWIKKGTPAEEVMANLSKANFDPEFTKDFTEEVIKKFNKEHATIPVKNHKRKGIRKLLRI